MTMKKLFFFTGALAMLACAFLSTSCSNNGGELPTLWTDAPAEINFDADGTGGMPFIGITTNQASWAHSLSPADGGGWLGATAAGNMLVLTAQPNETPLQRGPVVIRITAGDAVPVEITVKQDGFAREGNTLFHLEGLSGDVAVKFTNGDTDNAALNTAGYVIFAGSSPLRTIYSITTTASGEVLIGRAEGEEINLKFDAGALTFRDAVNGRIPVGSYAEFMMIATDATSRAGIYLQESDIDLLGAESLMDAGLDRQQARICDKDKRFTGSYDGGGFAFDNIYFSRAWDGVGLFGYLDTGGTLKNITVTGGRIEGYNYVGGVCGYNYGTIENCSNGAAISNHPSAANNGYVGGVCGYNDTGTISACYNTGAVSSNQDVGGVVGYSRGDSAYLIACYNIGVVSGNSGVGGVCGYNEGYMKTCYWLKRGTEVGANYSPGGAWAFGESSWPDTTMRGWGTGDGSADNTYWKPLTPDPLGKWVAGGTPNGINSVFPKLWYEK